MSLNSDRSKRIAKNTLMLYFRMILMMLIGLYTSRVVLQTLGVVDYGINNVVGGVITMLSFLTGALGGATSRYITYGLGKGDLAQLKQTFGNILTIHYALAVIVLILGETIGLWFLNTVLQIPPDRANAAFWVYQFSILSSMMAVVSVPYNAAVIAHEKMSAFAYMSLLDGILKLVIVFLLVTVPFDKLIVYSFLFFIVQCVDRLIYYYYCKKKFIETHAPCSYDKKMFKEIFAYAGWMMNGSLADMGYTQGLNMLLNIFFGPAVNAARGIAVQVQGISQQFCTNFQMALNPQITKSYAQEDFGYMHSLLIRSSKFSFYIMFFIALPLMLEAEFVLRLWLGIVPDYTVTFVRLTLVVSLLFTLKNPINVSVHATGKIKRFQMIEANMLLSIVPIAYLLLKFGNVQPWTVFLVHIVVEIFTQVARLKIVLPMINMSILTYLQQVLKPVLATAIIAPIFPVVCYYFSSSSFVSFFIICIVSVCCLIPTIFYIGCSSGERLFLTSKVQTIFCKIKKK